MGSINNEEELCWLSSSHVTEGSDDASKSTFKLPGTEASPFKSIANNNMDSKANIDGLPINIFNNTYKNLRTQMDVDNDAEPGSLIMFSESDMNSGNIGDFKPKEKVSYYLSILSSSFTT